MQVVTYKPSVDYIKLIVHLSNHNDFFEFVNDEQFSYFGFHIIEYNLIEILFPNNIKQISNILFDIKILKDKNIFLNKYKEVANEIFLNSILQLTNIFQIEWTEEDFIFMKNLKFKNMFIPNEITENYVLFILKHFKRWDYIKLYCKEIYEYIIERFPIPNDFDLKIYSPSGYVYMIEHNIKEYPISKVSGKYVEWNSGKGQFNMFRDYEEQFSELGKKLIQEKISKTNIIKYGHSCCLQNEEINKKARETSLNKYGVLYHAQREEMREHMRQIYDKTYKNNSEKLKEREEKMKKTNMKKRNVEYVSQDEEIKQKVKNTNIKKRNVEYSLQDPSVRKQIVDTMLQKYGDCVPNRIEIFKQKTIQTNLERYGCEYPAQNKDIWMKSFETRIRNHKGLYSKSENLIYNLLLTIFEESDILRQYKSDVYPFYCDFYIKSLDLYIEYNGYWSHGKHPFDKNNINDVEKANTWLQKNSKHYENAYNVWTKKDIIKRKYANENFLNYKELWSIEESYKFINHLIQLYFN